MLHELDFYLWTTEQAKILENKDYDKADWENIIEEIKDMGNNKYEKVSSWVIRIMQHKLKLDYVGTADCLKHWRKEIGTFQVYVERNITTTIKLKLMDEWEVLYKNAKKLFKLDYAEIEVPEDCPYNLDDLLE